MAESTYSIYEDDGMNDDVPPPPTDNQYGDLISDDQPGDATAISHPSPLAPAARATSPGTPPRASEVLAAAQADESMEADSERKEAAPDAMDQGTNGRAAVAGDGQMGGFKSMRLPRVAVQAAGVTESSAGLPSKVSSAAPRCALLFLVESLYSFKPSGTASRVTWLTGVPLGPPPHLNSPSLRLSPPTLASLPNLSSACLTTALPASRVPE